MRSKTFTAVLLSAIFAAIFPGCVTPTQGIALANAEAGNAYATYELGKSAANLKGLQDFAAALPLIPQGKVSPTQLGVINAELLNAQSGTQGQLQSQIGSLISLVSQAQLLTSGGNLTAEGGIVVADCTDVANGINNGIQFWQGQQSVVNPSPAASGTAKAAAP